MTWSAGRDARALPAVAVSAAEVGEGVRPSVAVSAAVTMGALVAAEDEDEGARWEANLRGVDGTTSSGLDFGAGRVGASAVHWGWRGRTRIGEGAEVRKLEENTSKRRLERESGFGRGGGLGEKGEGPKDLDPSWGAVWS